MKVPFAAVHMFMDIIALGGYKPGVRILPHQFIPAPAEIADKLRLQEGDTLAFAPKVFYASGTPCAYIEDYFDAKVLKNPEELEAIEAYDGTLFDYLNKHWRRRIVWDRTEIKTAVVEEGTRLAQELKENKEVKAVLLLDCVNFDQYDEPLIYAKEYVDTSYIQFNSIRYKKF